MTGQHHDSSRKWLLIALCLQAVTRIPFVFLGYGGDDDAWRVAWVARELLATGNYSPSRFPGYPLFEAVNALLIPAGKWYLSNSATLAISLITLFVFYKIIRQLNLKYQKQLLILFVFFPLLWTNSANTMDYFWALLLILSSFYFLLRERLALAAVFLGISAGFRLTSFVFIIPFSIYLIVAGRKNRVPVFLLISIICGLAAFSPPLLKYGFRAFKFYKPHIHELTHIPYYAVYTMGIPASLVLLYGIARYGGRLWRSLSDGDAAVTVCAASVITVFVLFCFAPQDRVYLLPLFPFLFILIARFFEKKIFILFMVLSLAYGFFRIEIKDPYSVDAVRVRPHFAEGAVVGSYQHRKGQFEMRKRIGPFLRKRMDLTEKGVFVSGWIVGLPHLMDNDDFKRISIPGVRGEMFSLRGTKTVVMVGAMSEESYNYFKDNGYRMLFLEGAIRYSKNAFGFEINTSKEEIIQLREILE